ncbi:Vegetative incompatibility protein HET-E-1 [Purpureocillium lavendulum]|uniref:Vegetative incompatibility protein HET-E-1 n=1 Tax=Purpureocillium lavendulum TaxID=1247861 RepID=A0AB34FJ57_9HYPO|nr:Vegetative incompatibility protein HET-E-1 [Purpureocillium lavendulum]
MAPGSEQVDVQRNIEPSGKKSEPTSSFTEPTGNAQTTPASTVANAPVTRSTAVAPRTPGPDLVVEHRAESLPVTEFPAQSTHSMSTSQRLWNAAYDRLKDGKDTAELVTAYVSTLLKVLGAGPEIALGVDVATELDDPTGRQLLMKKLVDEGRSKFGKVYKIAKRVDDFAQAVLLFKPLGDLAVSIPQAAPAALPWAGVCIGLQMLSNPAATAKSNLAGITHVLSRMEWYDAVTKHLLNEAGLEIKDGSLEVMRQLEAKVVALYEALLLYQMKSICNYYRHQGYVFLRGLALRDDWDADLKIVTDAEATLQRDSDQYNRLEERNTLEKLVESGKGIEASLGDIRQDIRELIASQKTARSNDEGEKCLQALFVINPQDHMTRIEDEKDKLLYEAYEWMLHTYNYAAFTSWGQPELPPCQLLWIKGPAGTGKTMLVMGIIRELSKRSAALAPSISYFFCQGTDETEFYTLRRIFEDMLGDPALSAAYLIVDALDEFNRTKPGLDELIQLISYSLVLSKKVKWLISSRPEIDLLSSLKDRNANTLNTRETLVELNTERLANPVHAYIEHKLSTLKDKRGYDDAILSEVSKAVHERAKDNFLWIFLAFNDLKDVSGKDILTTTSLAFRPLSLVELEKLFPWSSNTDPYTIVKKCGSFLTITEETVSLVHQSAKDYLTQSWLQTDGIAQGHASIGKRSIDAMSPVLKQNMYNLDYGFKPRDIRPPEPDPLAPLQYSCVFWADHLAFEKGQSTEYHELLADDGEVLLFLKEKVLYWLESLSLLGNLSDGALSVKNLLHTAQVVGTSSRLAGFLEDTDKFIRSHGSIIERAPMQTYGTALAFSPTTSVVKNSLWKHRLPFIHKILGIEEDWDAHRQTLEGHYGSVTAVAFSADGKTLASASRDATVRLWDAATGMHRKTLEGHTGWVMAVAFVSGGQAVASASRDGTVRLWDTATGTARKTLESHSDCVTSVAFAPSGKALASISHDRTIRLWDTATRTAWKTLVGHSSSVRAVAFSPQGETLASGSDDQTARLWDTATGTGLKTLVGHGGSVMAVALSPDGKTLASASDDRTVRLWDTTTGTCRKTLEGHSGSVRAVAVSPDGEMLASGSDDRTVRLWDTDTGMHRQTLYGHSGSVRSITAVAFSPDGKMLASASDDETVRLWDTATDTHRRTIEGHSSWVMAVAFSPDGKMLASASEDRTVRLWDTATGRHREVLEHHSSSVRAVAFSPHGEILASGSDDETVRLWDTATGTHLKTLEGHSDWVTSVAFSADGEMLASASDDRTIRLWDVATRTHSKTLEGHSSSVRAVAFSPDGETLASASHDKTVRLWDMAKRTHWKTLKGHSDWVTAIAFSADGETLASASDDRTVRLWDVATGTHRQTLEGHRGSVMTVTLSPDGETLAFSPDGRFLTTNHGSLRLPSTVASLAQCADKSSPNYALYIGDGWITADGRNCLWLPKDYRPTVIALDGNQIAMGHKSGRVTIFEVDFAQ